MVILYLYNKNQTYDKLEHFDDSVINQLASIINDGKITFNNVDITGELKVNKMNPLKDTIKMNNVDIAGELKVNRINPLKDTIKMNNVDISKQLILPKNTIGPINNITIENLTAPNITTNSLSLNKKDGNYININDDVEIKNNKSIKVRNIQTNNINAGYTEWVNFPNKVDLQSTFRLRGDDIYGTTKVMAGKQSWLTW